MTAPLYGLVLSGGRSQRMQRDKATLEYAGQSQLARAVALLEPLVERCFVSTRADQRGDAQREVYQGIVDLVADIGPLAGIHAALHAHPQAAWLVLACDLPFLDAATLQQLIAARAPQRLASAFRSSHDGKPEPLCAIYEPDCRAAIDAWIAADQRCPRSFLAQAEVLLLTLHNPRALDNVNTAEEYQQARATLAGEAVAPSGAMTARRLKIQYFAILREQAGRSEETLESSAADARALYEELRGLQLRPEQLRVAINDRFGDWSQPLQAGDRIAFLPPVAGG
jgi:molybdopterin-guanine dinucleotide biosynthesis protein A